MTRKKPTNPKSDSLKPYRQEGLDSPLTSNQAIPIENDQDSLKLGERGPTLMEDFHLREKLTHFDHERIPSVSCMRAAAEPTVCFVSTSRSLR